MSSPIIRPYVEISPLSKTAFKSIGFRLTELHLHRTTEGWLRLLCDWTARKDDRYKVKYPGDEGRGWSGGAGQEAEYVEFEFPLVSAPYHPASKDRLSVKVAKENKAGIIIGIYIQTGRRRNPPSLTHRYTHCEKTKYGVCMWFAPKEWGEVKDEQKDKLFSWQSPQYKRDLR